MLTLDSLFEPIAGDSACGVDLAFSPELDAIARARQFDDASLDQGVWIIAHKEADWPFVARRSFELLATQSKDLQLAVWLAEAYAKTRAFRGIGDGYFLLAGLCERYWDELYPLAEDGDCERRIGNLAWVLSRSPQLFREMAITQGEPGYSMQDIEQARRGAGGAADIERARGAGSRAFYEALLDDCDYCMRALVRFEQIVDALAAKDGPSFAQARTALQDVIDTIAPAARAAGVGGEHLPESAQAGGQGDGAVSDPNAAPSMSGAIVNRAQALARLRAIAEFFRKTEPHSPVAYLADKAASWGEMPLHVWLRAVVKDQSALAQLDELLGTRSD